MHVLKCPEKKLYRFTVRNMGGWIGIKVGSCSHPKQTAPAFIWDQTEIKGLLCCCFGLLSSAIPMFTPSPSNQTKNLDNEPESDLTQV